MLPVTVYTDWVRGVCRYERWTLFMMQHGLDMPCLTGTSRVVNYIEYIRLQFIPWVISFYWGVALQNFYLSIDGMEILSVHKFMFLLVWTLDTNVGSINAPKHVREPPHGIKMLLLTIGFRMCRHFNPSPHMWHESSGHSVDCSACSRLVNPDQITHNWLEWASSEKTQSQAYLKQWAEWALPWQRIFNIIL